MSLGIEVILRITQVDGVPVCENVTKRVIPRLSREPGWEELPGEVANAYQSLREDVRDGMDRMQEQVAQVNEDILGSS